MKDIASSPDVPADLAASNRVLRLPSRALLKAFLWDATWVTVLWFIVYGGANWITEQHGYRVRLWTSLDLSIPYAPWAAVVYLSVLPMMWMCPLVIRSNKALRSFSKSLALLIVISGIGFLLLPGYDVYPPRTSTGVGATLANFADQVNLTYNYLPSLHVGMAVVCAYYYAEHGPGKIRLIWWTWAAAIAMSTLLTHHHYLIDVVVGAPLGLLCAIRFK